VVWLEMMGTTEPSSSRLRTNHSRRLAPTRPRNSFARNPAQAPSTPTPQNLSTTMQESTVAELMERFLAWLGRHRSDRTSRSGGGISDAYGGLRATSIAAWHLEMFQDDYKPSDPVGGSRPKTGRP